MLELTGVLILSMLFIIILPRLVKKDIEESSEED